ncbi:MAG: hypothetical protein JWM27_3135 [Gemmatimonadetes bacterium]|nr:hypothetical protein [Gemmatimonadota bacterium]
MAGKYLAPGFRVSVDGSDLTLDLSLQVTRVSVKLAADGMDECSLSLANPYPELPWTHGSQKGLFTLGSGLKVQMGYVDKLKDLFDGEVTAMTVSFPEGGHAALEVQGKSRLHRLQASFGPFTYPNATDEAVVKKVAQRSSLGTKVDATEATYATLTQGSSVSDLAFLRERARLVGREMFVTGTTLNFVKPREAGGEAYTLVWGRTAKAFASPGEYVPLLSFTPTSDAEAQVSEVVVRWYDAATMKVIEGKAGKGAEAAQMGAETGGAAAVSAFGGARKLVVTDKAVATPAEAEAHAKARLNELEMNFIRGTGSSVGLPDLAPGKVVKIDGVGPYFGGKYYVTQVTHVVSTGGYRSDFTVRRNASGT